MKRMVFFLFAAVLWVNMTAVALAANAGKVAIVTNTVSQGEEEFRSAEQMKDKYGDRIVHATWPDNFMAEQEKMIAIVAALAADPEVKALIINQAVPGTNAAVDKLLETRKDVVIVYCTPQESASDVAARANLILLPDGVGMGNAIPVQAKKMGAETLVHYSFPRHMSQVGNARQRDAMKRKCDELGIQFVEAEVPDPLSDGGLPGTQAFVLADTPKMVEKYGPNTAFYSTNCAVQIPLIQAIVDAKAIYPLPCCPSPYHGFPAALGIQSNLSDPDNLRRVVDETKNVLAAAGMTGRVSTWPVPNSMAYTAVGTEYAMRIMNGEASPEKLDKALVEQLFSEYAGIDVTTTPYTEDDAVYYQNYLMNVMAFLTY